MYAALQLELLCKDLQLAKIFGVNLGSNEKQMGVRHDLKYLFERFESREMVLLPAKVGNLDDSVSSFTGEFNLPR